VDGLKEGFRFATAAEIVDHFGCQPGYLGPIGTRKPVRVVADRTVAMMSDFVCGANEGDAHYTGVNWGRDLPEPDLVADIRNVVAGDPSPDGKGALAIQRGIECPIGWERSEQVRLLAQRMHDELAAAGVDVVVDDRGERPGAMFADWELLGVPLRLVVSDRGLKAGTVEVQGRRDAQATVVPVPDAVALAWRRLHE